jgi:hypothetical protein
MSPHGEIAAIIHLNAQGVDGVVLGNDKLGRYTTLVVPIRLILPAP